MRLFLVRHAPTAETGKRLSGRTPGIDLSAPGRELAEAVASELAERPLAAVYTSPLERCRQTAAAVAGPHRLRPRVRAALTEVDYGAWSGRPLAGLRRLRMWQDLLAAPSRFRFPDGSESLPQAQARVVAAIEALAAAHARAEVAAVTHNDAIRLAVAHYLGMPIDLFHRLHVAPASITVIELDGAGPPRVPVVNRMPMETPP